MRVVIEKQTSHVVIQPCNVVIRDYDGPESYITTRAGGAGRLVFGPERSLSSAVDEAFRIVGEDGKDAVVWSGNRVAAVVSRGEDGRIAVTDFMDISASSDD